MRKLMILGAILGMIGLASPAQADEILQVYQAGVAGPIFSTTFTSGTVNDTGDQFIGPGANFELHVQVESNSPGTATLANLQNVTVNAINHDAASGHTYYIVFGDVNFNPFAASKSNLQSSMSGTFGTSNPASGTASGDSAMFTSYVDPSNVLGGGLANGVGPPFTPTGGSTVSPTATATSTGAFGLDFSTAPHSNLFTVTPFSTPAGKFSLTTLMTITLGSAASGPNGVQITGTESVIPGPEPASLLLLCSAIPILGAAGYLRRKKAVQMA